MRYEIGDIVKISIPIQEGGLRTIAILCPYIEVTEAFDSEARMSAALWGNTDLLSLDDGRILTNTNYFFNPRGSVLVADAMPVSNA